MLLGAKTEIERIIDTYNQDLGVEVGARALGALLLVEHQLRFLLFLPFLS